MSGWVTPFVTLLAYLKHGYGTEDGPQGSRPICRVQCYCSVLKDLHVREQCCQLWPRVLVAHDHNIDIRSLLPSKTTGHCATVYATLIAVRALKSSRMGGQCHQLAAGIASGSCAGDAISRWLNFPGGLLAPCRLSLAGQLVHCS